MSLGAGRHGALRQERRQRRPLEVLHHQVIDPVLAADVVDGADVGVAQRRQAPRFALEPLTDDWIGGQRRGQDLDRDGAIEPRVAGRVDFAHTAGAERAGDLVRAEAGAR